MRSSTNHHSLAVRYRPQNFDEIIGQKTLVTTLSQAIKQGQCPSAILLTGIRGTGKTSVARLIAKAINCVNNSQQLICGQCEQCLSIANGNAIDILEMDAASNTSVNDIRDIIANIRYKPVTSSFKVYIIDEAHMLSTGAFNALLKTLEEPPPHTKLILATTEVAKIPSTIISRCQRFNLRRLTQLELSKHYQKVAQSEGYDLIDEAATLLANAADGSVRDGMSMLEQAINLSGSETNITTATVEAMLGTAHDNLAHSIIAALSNGNLAEAISLVEQAYYGTKDLPILAAEILALLHEMAVTKATDATIPTTLSSESIDLAQQLSMPFLLRAWQVFSNLVTELKQQDLPLVFFKMTVIKVGYLNTALTPEVIAEDLSSTLSTIASKVPSAPDSSPSLSREKADNSRLHDSSRPKQAAPLALRPDSPAPPQTPKEERSGSKPVSSFEALLQLALEAEEVLLYHWLTNEVAVNNVDCENAIISITPGKHCHNGIQRDIAKQLQLLTNLEWQVRLSSSGDTRTYHENKALEQQEQQDRLLQSSLVQDIMEAFPGLSK